MESIESVLQQVYELGYNDGWRKRDMDAPYFGKSPATSLDNLHPVLGDSWTEKAHDAIDVDNVYFVEQERGMPSHNNRRFLHYQPPTDDDSLTTEQIIKHELGSIHSRIKRIEDPVEVVELLEGRVQSLMEENAALRATHPDGNTDIEFDDDPTSTPDTWSLSSEGVGEAKTTVPLDGDHVFDKAEIEYDLEVSAKKGELGTVFVNVEIQSLNLVSRN